MAQQSIKRGPHPNRRQSKPPTVDVESLYHEFLRLYYDEGDRRRAGKFARQLAELLASSPELAESIRGEEIRSLLAEFRGDFQEAARSREAEIRKILELHSLAVNTPHWKFVRRQYDFRDVSDRLDLLAILYDRQGDRDRAIATLLESKRYCESHSIEFDAQDVLDELTRSTRTRERAAASSPKGRVRKAART